MRTIWTGAYTALGTVRFAGCPVSGQACSGHPDGEVAFAASQGESYDIYRLDSEGHAELRTEGSDEGGGDGQRSRGWGTESKKGVQRPAGHATRKSVTVS